MMRVDLTFGHIHSEQVAGGVHQYKDMQGAEATLYTELPILKIMETG